MVIESLEEKRMIVANYYRMYRKSDNITPNYVFRTWTSFFKHDFRVDGYPIFIVKQGHLKFKTNVREERMDDAKAILEEYDNLFQSCYNWICDYVKTNNREQSIVLFDNLRTEQELMLNQIANPLGLTVCRLQPRGNGEKYKKLCYYFCYLIDDDLKNVKRNGTYKQIKKYLEKVVIKNEQNKRYRGKNPTSRLQSVSTQ